MRSWDAQDKWFAVALAGVFFAVVFANVTLAGLANLISP